MKVHIIGGAGSGKSYISKKLSKALNIKNYELDEIFWDDSDKTFNKKATSEFRNNKLNKILKQDNWIIEGVYYSWLYESFKKADTIIILNPNIIIQQYRIVKRFLKRKFGYEKSNKKESLSNLLKLMKWNYNYNKKKIKIILEFINDFSEKIYMTKNNRMAYKHIIDLHM